MATRTFTDRAGTEWMIWQVVPGRHSLGSQRHTSTLPEELAEGWLCFESGQGKRRVYPVPPEWESLTDHQLEILLRAGVPVAARPAYGQVATAAAA